MRSPRPVCAAPRVSPKCGQDRAHDIVRSRSVPTSWEASTVAEARLRVGRPRRRGRRPRARLPRELVAPGVQLPPKRHALVGTCPCTIRASPGAGLVWTSRQPSATRSAAEPMDASLIVTLLGGLGLFLLGIHHLTEGMKGLAGDSLRRALQRLVAGRFSAVASGAFFTAVIQPSTAAILTVIGFVSARLVNFSLSVGMIIGATLGTTSTIWLVAIFGLRFRISAAALPMLGIGAFLWLVARGKTRSLGAVLA